MENPDTNENTGKYTKPERVKFNEQFGPGAAVALESLRKQARIRIKATRRPNHPEPAE